MHKASKKKRQTALSTREQAIRILFWILILCPFLLTLGLLITPRSLHDIILKAIITLEIETLMVFAILFFRSVLINWIAIPSIIITGVVGIGFFTTNPMLTGTALFVATIFTPIIFIVTPFLFILFGIRSIKERETIVTVLGPTGKQTQSIQGPEAVGWGFIYTLIGLIFLFMIISAVLYTICKDSASGLCILNTTTPFTRSKPTQPNPPAHPPGPIRIQGTVVCLPHRDTSGPQTLECAYGLKDANGTYYGLQDADPSYKNMSATPMNSLVEVEGVFSPRTDSKYQDIGIIEITKISSRTGGEANVNPK